MSDRTRQERTGIEFPDATWTSFDRYDRYGAIARCLRATLGEGRHRVLDVGDAAGYLRLFAGEIRLVGVDLTIQDRRLPGAVALAGDGTRLPFSDGTFDAVVSSDVLEHVPSERRGAFVDELSRVSRDLVIVAAPFDTDGTAGVEEIVRRFALLATGAVQEQLEEHRDRGLPDLDETAAHLTRHGQVVTVGNGNLWDWLEMMLVKHQLLARPALLPLHDGIDALYNLSLAGRASEPPHYRHLLAARRRGDVLLGTIAAAAVPGTTMAGILANLVSAVGPESTRQDVRPGIDQVLAKLEDLRAEVAQDTARINERLDVSERMLSEMARPLRLLKPAVRRMRARGRRASRSDEPQ